MVEWSEEQTKLLQFLIEKSENAKFPLSITPLIHEFVWRFNVPLGDCAIREKIRRFGYKFPKLDVDMETKVKLMFALSITLDIDFLEELQEHAEVLVLDDSRRITQYKSKDGSVELKGIHLTTSDVRRKLSNCHEFIRFFAKNVKKYTRPMLAIELIRQFKRVKPSGYSYETLKRSFPIFKKEIYTLKEFDKETRIRMMFVSSASVPQYALRELKKEANIRLDDDSRIISYQATDGSLSLEAWAPTNPYPLQILPKIAPNLSESILEEESTLADSSWILDHSYAKRPEDEIDFMDSISEAVEEESEAEKPENPLKFKIFSSKSTENCDFSLDLTPKVGLFSPKTTQNAPNFNMNDRYLNRKPPKFDDFSIKFTPKPVKIKPKSPIFYGNFHGKSPKNWQNLSDFWPIMPENDEEPLCYSSIFHEKPSISMGFEPEIAPKSSNFIDFDSGSMDFQEEMNQNSMDFVGNYAGNVSKSPEMAQNTQESSNLGGEVRKIHEKSSNLAQKSSNYMDFGDEFIDFQDEIDQNSMDFQPIMAQNTPKSSNLEAELRKIHEKSRNSMAFQEEMDDNSLNFEENCAENLLKSPIFNKKSSSSMENEPETCSRASIFKYFGPKFRKSAIFSPEIAQKPPKTARIDEKLAQKTSNFMDFESETIDSQEKMDQNTPKTPNFRILVPKICKKSSNSQDFQDKLDQNSMDFEKNCAENDSKTPNFKILVPKFCQKSSNSMDFQEEMDQFLMDFEENCAENDSKLPKIANKSKYFPDFEVETFEKSNFSFSNPNPSIFKKKWIKILQNRRISRFYCWSPNFQQEKQSIFNDSLARMEAIGAEIHQNSQNLLEDPSEDSVDFGSSEDPIFNDFGSENPENPSKIAPKMGQKLAGSMDLITPKSPNFKVLLPKFCQKSFNSAQNASKSPNSEDSRPKIIEKSINLAQKSSNPKDFLEEMDQNSMDFEEKCAENVLKSPEMTQNAPKSPDFEVSEPKIRENSINLVQSSPNSKDFQGETDQNSNASEPKNAENPSEIASKEHQNLEKSSVSVDFEQKNPENPSEIAPEIPENRHFSPEMAQNSMDLAPKLAQNAPKSLDFNDFSPKNPENCLFSPGKTRKISENDTEITESVPKNPESQEEVSRESPAPSVIIEEDSDIEILETEDEIQVIETENSRDSVDLERSDSPPYLEVLFSIRTMVIVLDFFDFSEIREKIEWKMEKFRLLDKKTPSHALLLGFEACFRVVTRNSAFKPPPNENSASLRDFLTLLRSTIFNLDVSSLHDFQLKVKEHIGELTERDQYIPIRNLQEALEIALDIFSP